jgi:hypothetical protein
LVLGRLLGLVHPDPERYLPMPMPQRKQLAGQRFGRLIAEVWVPGALRKGAWRCVCDCGQAKLASSTHLTKGVVTSCGCLRPKHGGKGTRAYSIWRWIIGRCAQRGHKNWSDYGGRGIGLCDRWMRFENFLADMGQPEPGATIERRDNDGNYEPENCYWATRKAQARNTRRSIVITFDGRTQSLAAWAEEFGANYWLIHSRHKAGWAPERIFKDLLR